MVHVVIVSDSHLSRRAPLSGANWDAVVAHVADTRPELVVHAGDISLDGASNDDDLVYARSHLDRLAVPWLSVPGNHDVGDATSARSPLTDSRRERYSQVFGNGFWLRRIGGWNLVGVDCQVLSAPVDDAEQRWAWLDAALASDGPTVLFQHRPLLPISIDEPDDAHRYVNEPFRSRLRAMVSTHRTAAIVSGHVHQWRCVPVDGVTHIWAPSTWAKIRDARQPVIGHKVVGLVDLTLGESPQASLVTPQAMAQATVGETIPSPYPA
ncbi:MAG: metallophosphoesterase [Actinomycetota bacterium]